MMERCSYCNTPVASSIAEPIRFDNRGGSLQVFTAAHNLCFFRLSYDDIFWVQKLTTNNSIIKVELPRQKVLNFTKLFSNVYLVKLK